MINSNSSAPRQQHLPRHTTTPQHTHPQFYGQIWKLRGDNVSEPRVWMTDCDWPPSALAGSPPGHWTQRGHICIFCQILSLYGNKPSSVLRQHHCLAVGWKNDWEIVDKSSVKNRSWWTANFYLQWHAINDFVIHRINGLGLDGYG